MGLGLGIKLNLRKVIEDVGYPAILDIARAWYDYLDLGVIKDGSDFVSVFNDKNAEGNDLLQSTGTDQPLWTSDGILHDGISEFLKTLPFTLVQPTFIYMVFKQITWLRFENFIDGNISSSSLIFQDSSSPDISAYAGRTLVAINPLALNTYGIIRVLFNGDSSKIIINMNPVLEGGLGNQNMLGLTLGSRGGGGQYSHIEVKGVAIFDETFNSLPTPTEDQAIYDYFKSYYNLSI